MIFLKKNLQIFFCILMFLSFEMIIVRQFFSLKKAN